MTTSLANTSTNQRQHHAAYSHVHDLGHHGRISQVPPELKTCLEVIFQRLIGTTKFTAHVVNRRLPPSEFIVKPIRIEQGALVLDCWPTDDAAKGGRQCFIYLDRPGEVDRLFGELQTLVNDHELRRNNWQRFVREGRLHNPVEEDWTRERLYDLTAVILYGHIGSSDKRNLEWTARFAEILGHKVTSAQVLKHLIFLEKKGWLRLVRLGNHPTFHNIHPGREMIRLFAQESGAINPDDTSDETLDHYITNTRWIQHERLQALQRLNNAQARLPRAEKRLDQALAAFEAAQAEVDAVKAAIDSATADLETTNDITTESHPILSRLLEKMAPQLAPT